MADIENWLILGMSCCTNTKDPKEIKRQKFEATFEYVSGDFLVGFIVHRGLKYQRIHFRAAVGALGKKSHILFVRKGYELVLLPFNCRSIRRIGLVRN